MKRDYVSLYAMAVCFIAAVILSVTLAKSIYNGLQIAMPALTMPPHIHDRFQSDERYLRNWPENRPIPDADALKRLRAENYQLALTSVKRSGMLGLINSAIGLFVLGVVFLIHWRIIRRQRN